MKSSILTTKELRLKKPEEIASYIAETKAAFADYKHQLSINKQKQTHKLKLMKKAIAKANTILNEQAKSEKGK